MDFTITEEEKEKRKKKIMNREKKVRFTSEMDTGNSNDLDIETRKELADELEEHQPTPYNDDDRDKLVDIKIDDNGRVEIKGLIKNGKEDTKEYSATGLLMPSDREKFEIEKRFIENGEITEVAERTLQYHKQQDYWNDLKSKIDKDEVEVKTWR